MYKQWKNGKNSSFRIYKARYQSGTYLLLLGNRKLQNFEISHEYFLLRHFTRII